MSQAAIKNELHAIVDSLDESDLPVVLGILRGMSGDDRGQANHLTFEDPLWDIVGMIDDDGPTDMAENHDRYLADAYADTHDDLPR